MFIDASHKATISSYAFTGASYYAMYENDDSDKEYSILDFHNFKCIKICDVEAG